jgi:peptidyl-prolyl cis-trans isomerase SurA
MKLKYFLCVGCLSFAFAGGNNPQSVSSMQTDTSATRPSAVVVPPAPAVQSINSLDKGNTAIPFTESQARALSTQKIKTINRVVAFVNKGIVTSNQVDAMMTQTLQTFKQKGIANSDSTEIREKVIDQLVMQQIQLDLAERSGIKTNDLEVNDAISNMAKAQNTTVEGLKATVAKQGISYDDFRTQIQSQITMEKLKQREVDGRVIVNDDEVNRVLNSEAYKSRVDYRLAMISISIPEQATADVVQQRQAVADKAYNELKSGVTFDKVAVKYSNSPNALSGGDLGWRSSAALPPVIADKLNNLPTGGFTPVIKLPYGFFIFKVNEIRKHGTLQIVKQYHVRHILVKVNENTSDDEARQKINEVKSKLDQGAKDPTKLNSDFIKYAKQYSEDTSSISGGDIGWVSSGDTVPAFEQTILKTPIGVVSDPVRTPFGWHILQVTGIRDSNLTNDREKAAIRQELRDNKATMLYAQWIRDIREMAYVKMNDD